MPRKPKTLSDFDLSTRIGRFRARQAGHNVPKRENTGFGKAYWSKDANHDEIVNGLQARGFDVYAMPQPGDILVYGLDVDDRHHRWMPMEIKTAGGRKTKNQADRTQQPIPTVRNLADALALYGILESGAK